MHSTVVTRVARAAAALSIVALASCSGAAPNAPGLPAASASSDLRASAPPACPAPGPYKHGKVSSSVASIVALPGTLRYVNWTVTFKHQPTGQPPVRYVSSLTACGVAAKPAGKVGYTSGGTTGSHCVNGECTITVTYTVFYRAPKKPPKLPWKYDLIRFAPFYSQPPYGVLNAALVEIKS
jgi:hypothetical protein